LFFELDTLSKENAIILSVITPLLLIYVIYGIRLLERITSKTKSSSGSFFLNERFLIDSFLATIGIDLVSFLYSFVFGIHRDLPYVHPIIPAAFTMAIFVFHLVLLITVFCSPILYRSESSDDSKNIPPFIKMLRFYLAFFILFTNGMNVQLIFYILGSK
jgi:hypothetical protein